MILTCLLGGWCYSVIAGRAVKKEYLALATFGSIGAVSWLASRRSGGSQPAKQEETKIESSSKEEEEFIKSFIAEAEKEEAAAAKH